MFIKEIEETSLNITNTNSFIEGIMLNPEIKINDGNMKYYFNNDNGIDSENHFGGLYKSINNGYYIYFGTISKTNLATKDHYSLLRMLELRSLIIHTHGSEHLVNEIISSLSWINKNSSERILLFNQINMKVRQIDCKPFYVESWNQRNQIIVIPMFNFTNADNHYKEIIKCIRMGYASNPARFNSKCRLCFVFNTPICMKGIIIVSEICKLLKYNKGFTNVLITDDNSYESSIDQIEHFVDDTIDVIND